MIQFYCANRFEHIIHNWCAIICSSLYASYFYACVFLNLFVAVSRVVQTKIIVLSRALRRVKSITDGAINNISEALAVMMFLVQIKKLHV